MEDKTTYSDALELALDQVEQIETAMKESRNDSELAEAVRHVD